MTVACKATCSPPGVGLLPIIQVYKRVGILQVEAYKKIGKSIQLVILKSLLLKYCEQTHLVAVSFHLVGTT